MYRNIFPKIILLVLVCGFISACGQSGALVHPSDPNYDKRSHYLLYPNVEQKTVQTQDNTSEASSSPAQN